MTVRAEQRSIGVATDRENRERNDFYPTPREGIEALLSVETFDGPIWECACGDGAISRVLEERGHVVISTDLVDRGYGESKVDFLLEWRPRAPNIITNPPFKNIPAFITRAVDLTRGKGKVALLMRLACLEGKARVAIYRETPLARVWVFESRLTIWRNGVKTSDAGGTVAFAWFVWDRYHTGRPSLGWL